MSDKNTHVTSMNFPQRKRQKKLTVNTSPFICGCGGGQSCIVDRRIVGDWVHEDDVFRKAGLPLRKHCLQPYYKTQESALSSFMNHQEDQLSINDRWTEDSKTDKL